MRKLVSMILAFGLVALPISLLTGQSPDKPPAADKQKQKDFRDSTIVTRMLAFNKKKDGKLTKEEVTDARLLRLFEQADANKDGVVTREELTALAAKLDAEWGPGNDRGFGGPKGGKGFGGPKGKGPPGGPGDKGPKGKGPPGGPGAPPA